MLIELDVFSGRPNPTWNLRDEQAADFLVMFNALKPNSSLPAPYNGLGYRGFKVVGFRDYDQMTVQKETVEASRGDNRFRWRDEPREIERFLLTTSREDIDEDLYKLIASEIDQH